MINKELQITQYVFSLISSTFFVLSNILLGWGTLEAQQIAAPVLCAYNALDIFLGQHWKTDILMLVHHSVALVTASFIYLLNENTFTPEIYQISYYVSLGEISTIFNGLRWFYYGTRWELGTKLLFAVAFLIIRPISNIGLFMVIRDFYQAESFSFSFYLLTFSCLVYTCLNIIWGRLIVLKMLREYQKIKVD